MAIYNIANSESAFSALSLLDGDTVNIAAGTATWSSPHTINVGVKIFGAGSPTPITGSMPTTIIQCSFPVGGTQNQPLFLVNTDTVASFRCSGIAFHTTNSTQDGNTRDTFITVVGTEGNKAWRIDHCDFLSNVLGTSASQNPAILTSIWVQSAYPGLIDQNTFESATNSEIIHNWGSSIPGSGTFGEDGGTSPSQTAGTFNANADAALADWGNPVVQNVMLFVENNIFTNNQLLTGSTNSYFGNSSIQNYYGARITFRYNTLNFSQFDAHGGGSFGVLLANIQPGTRWSEVYNNSFVVPVPAGGNTYNQSQLIAFRGGTGVIWGNTLTANSGVGSMNINLLQDYNGDSGGSGTYPQLYQVGQGLLGTTGTGINGGAASAQNPSVLTVIPLAIWSNNAASAIAFSVDSSSTTYIQSGRDYNFSTDATAKPSGYVPYTYPYPWGGITGKLKLGKYPRLSVTCSIQ